MRSLGSAFDWLGVQRAWTRTRGNSDVLVAIVDAGVQTDHPLLSASISATGVKLPPNDQATEIHGTQAAGIVAGRLAQDGSFSGVAPAARILPVRYAAQGTDALDLAHAIEYAVEMGACIVHLARDADLGAPGVHRAIEYAATRNALVVCAARSGGDPAAPTEDSPNLLRVFAVDAQCLPITGEPDTAAAHLAAPGFARAPKWRDAGHEETQGAGLGAAYVSGCAALIKSQNPGWGYHEIREHLIASGTARQELAAHCKGGSLLNIADAVLGPIEHLDETGALTWSSLNGAELQWRLRYRPAFCVNVVALYRPHGGEHWREIAYARAGTLKMTVPASALRRSCGVLRLACRESNFYAEDRELTIC